MFFGFLYLRQYFIFYSSAFGLISSAIAAANTDFYNLTPYAYSVISLLMLSLFCTLCTDLLLILFQSAIVCTPSAEAVWYMETIVKRNRFLIMNQKVKRTVVILGFFASLFLLFFMNATGINAAGLITYIFQSILLLNAYANLIKVETPLFTNDKRDVVLAALTKVGWFDTALDVHKKVAESLTAAVVKVVTKNQPARV